MATVLGVRLTKQLEKAVDEVIKEQSVDKSTALRLLVSIGYKEWRLRRALQMLREGRISLSKAAEVAGMSVWDFLAEVKKEGIEWAEFKAGELLQNLR